MTIARVYLFVLTVIAALAVDVRIRTPAPLGVTPPTAQLARANTTPLRFEQNVGQFDPSTRFVARAGGATLLLTDEGIVVRLTARSRTRETRSARLRAATSPTAASTPGLATFSLSVHGGRSVVPIASRLLPTTTSYFLGNDPAMWRSGVATYARVTYPRVLDDVDLVYHGEDGHLEYDFVVAPGGRAEAIALDVSGAESLSLTDEGDLRIAIAGGHVIQPRPRVYQRDRGVARDVEASYRLVGDHSIGFLVAAYDHDKELVIDPVLAYSTYFGGSAYDAESQIAVDAAFNVYVVGTTYSTALSTVGALQTASAGAADIFVTKLDSTGANVIATTYLGGASYDFASAISVDAAGNVLVAGDTSSTNFPVKGAAQSAYAGGGDVFIAKLDGALTSLVSATYLGGSAFERSAGIASDAGGNIYVSGFTGSTNFPTKSALQPTFGGDSYDGFVAKYGPSGASLLYATYLGGSGLDFVKGLAVDAGGNAYVSGDTASPDFPLANALQGELRGYNDAFVSKLNPQGTALVYSTYLGGSASETLGAFALDNAGSAYLAGSTSSTDFPTKNSLFSRNTDDSDVYLVKLDTTGSATIYATYLGGSGYEDASGLAVDPYGNAIVVGRTNSTDFPMKFPLQATNGGLNDAFITRVDAKGASVYYSTYLGGAGNDGASGVAVDAIGSAFVAGATSSNDYPTMKPVQAALGGSTDAFVAKIMTPGMVITPSDASVSVRTKKTFTASGGVGGPYVFSLEKNGSGATLAPSGEYQAGTKTNAVDVIAVADPSGVRATTTVKTNAAIDITPSSPRVAPGSRLRLLAAGGTGEGFTWSLVRSGSGASISPNGVYVAGAVAGMTDDVTVTDSLGATAAATVTVTAPSPKPDAPDAAVGGEMPPTAASDEGSGCSVAHAHARDASTAILGFALAAMASHIRRRRHIGVPR